MDWEQCKVLYREFLFRMVDRDLLSVHAGGDAAKLLGRLAAILIWVSLPFAGMAMGLSRGVNVGPEHSVIATTMLVVSVFSVLAWDSLLPDRRDVFVLAPLGVNAVTISVAKAAALFAALATTILVFNAIPSMAFSLALTPPGANLIDMLFSIHMYRAFAAYWLTMLLAGAFVLCSVISMQAVIAWLPRSIALRLSSVLQIGVLCTAMAVYFLQPSVTGKLMFAPENRIAVQHLPSYWFLGMFEHLNGMPNQPASLVLSELAQRAWTASVVLTVVTLAALTTSCFRLLRKVAEQPDLVPNRRRKIILIAGWSIQTAIVQWAVRTLLRSRQHRVLLAFYSGLGIAAIILFLHTPIVQVMSRTSSSDSWSHLNLPMIAASLVMTVCWVLGVRAVFSLPVELRANWMFQLALKSEAETLTGARRSLYIAGVLPVWLIAATAFLSLWPWRPALQHLLALGLFGTFLSHIFLHGFSKIPFACAYLPGTSNIHITFALSIMFGLNALFWAASFERQTLSGGSKYWQMTSVLAGACLVSWWRQRRSEAEAQIMFEEEPIPEVQTLGLRLDGYSEQPSHDYGKL